MMTNPETMKEIAPPRHRDTENRSMSPTRGKARLSSVTVGSRMRCVVCKKFTTSLEARLRNFNEQRCGHCGGGLYLHEPENQTHQ